jgi:peptide/nickel transport system substrate-binding protein
VARESYWASVARSRLTRRRALAAAAATSFSAALLAACGGGSSSSIKLDDAGTARVPGTVWFAKNDWKLEDETKQAVRGGIYRGSRDADQPSHFDPLTLGQGQSPYAGHTHEFLLAKSRSPGLDPRSQEAETPTPSLAESWEVADDGMSITFKMRPNVKWHPIAPVNGRVMDIDDWRTTDERFRAEGEYRSAMPSVIVKSEFPDARTMVWKLNAPNGTIFGTIFSQQWTYPIMPKELNANSDLAKTTVIGTNYKILDKHQPAIGYEYRKHAGYWGGDPFIERWHAPIIPEYANRYAQFLRGNIMDFTPTPRDILGLAKDVPGTVIVATPIPDDSTSWMQFGVINPTSNTWADPRVRIALRRSMNFKGIGEVLSAKAQLEAAGIPLDLTAMTHMPQHPGFWLDPDTGGLGAVSANYLYDVAEAKKLLTAAGLTTPVRIPYFSEAVVEASQLVIDSLKGSGNFEPDVRLSANATAHREIRTELKVEGFVEQISSSGDADKLSYRTMHSLGNEPRSPHPFPDAKLDQLIIAQRQELDVARRWQLLKEIQIRAAEHMPYVPGRHLFTSFSFRWPWLHNIGWGGTGSPPEGRPSLGGHLHWLSADMPSRDRPI